MGLLSNIWDSTYGRVGHELSNAWGDITGRNSQRDAVNAQTEATNNANQAALQIYNQQRQDLAPFRQVGLNALTSLSDPTLGVNPNDLANDPAYQFALQQGLGATSAGQSATGDMASGRAQKELTRYAEGLASQQYNNAYDRQFNRLSQLAGIGSGSSAQLLNSSNAYGNTLQNNIVGLGNANAGAAMQRQQNFSNLLGQGITAAALLA